MHFQYLIGSVLLCIVAAVHLEIEVSHTCLCSFLVAYQRHGLLRRGVKAAERVGLLLPLVDDGFQPFLELGGRQRLLCFGQLVVRIPEAFAQCHGQVRQVGPLAHVGGVREGVVYIACAAAGHDVFPVYVEGDGVARFDIERYIYISNYQVFADGMSQEEGTLEAAVGVDGHHGGIVLSGDFVFQIEDAAVKAQSRVVSVQIALQADAVTAEKSSP